MAAVTVLMVAEKPSIAAALSTCLCPGGPGAAQKRKGVCPHSPVHEYQGHFMGRPAKFKVTATTGHIYSLDFASEYNDWNRVAPGGLFHARTVRTYDPRGRMPEHIQAEAEGAHVLVLWLDCDREGENICFEVVDLALPQMSREYGWPGAYEGCVFRAHFSSLSAVDLQHAMDNLGQPDINQAHSVDARQEIDLRLGCAFSRLQTLYFRKHFGSQLKGELGNERGKMTVTYGPCQIPTLWFCVQRHCVRQAFVPAPFWRLEIEVQVSGTALRCHHNGGDIWDGQAARAKVEELRAAQPLATVRDLQTGRSRISRPLPLNTVALLKMASDELGIGPGDAMHLAEELYLKGILSYPRTETDKYPQNFDLPGTVRGIAGEGAPWAGYARRLLAEGLTSPRVDGTDVGDHPPITPVKMASESQCRGRDGSTLGWVLYAAVCTHFLASVSADALFEGAELRVELGGEVFVTSSSRCVQRGWMEVDDRDTSDEGPLDLRAYAGRSGQQLPVADVAITDHWTRPPGHLTESELLALMDQHGIGTDASMAQHVSNVQIREYVKLDPSNRQLAPSALGLALAHGYALVDQTLLLPSVRARIENACSNIARGLATKDAVIQRIIRIFERKFYKFKTLIDRLPLMLAVAFSQERGGNRMVAGGAAEEGLALFREAERRHQAITLEQLLLERDSVELAEEDGALEAPNGQVEEEEEESTEAIRRVQQALEELGFGPAAPPQLEPQPKAKAKDKAGASTRGPGQAPPNRAEPPGALRRADAAGPTSGAADVEAAVAALLQSRGGQLALSELSGLCPGVKKRDLEKMRLVELTQVWDAGGQWAVRLCGAGPATQPAYPERDDGASRAAAQLLQRTQRGGAPQDRQQQSAGPAAAQWGSQQSQTQPWLQAEQLQQLQQMCGFPYPGHTQLPYTAPQMGGELLSRVQSGQQQAFPQQYWHPYPGQGMHQQDLDGWHLHPQQTPHAGRGAAAFGAPYGRPGSFQ